MPRRGQRRIPARRRLAANANIQHGAQQRRVLPPRNAAPNRRSQENDEQQNDQPNGNCRVHRGQNRRQPVVRQEAIPQIDRPQEKNEQQNDLPNGHRRTQRGQKRAAGALGELVDDRLLQNAASPITMQEEDNIFAVPKPAKPNTQIKYYDVLINSYMRSGSTLTGKILGWRDDTFYFCEPLWNFLRWGYLHGNATICQSRRLACWSSGESLVMANKILRNIYDCRLKDFKLPVFNLGFAVKFGGPSWAQVATCMNDMGNKTLCVLRYAQRTCKNAIHRVTKVLRLTTDLLGDMLRDRPNLKIIHLFRDPRAIINSRNKTSWYPANTPNKLIENAKSLCNKMLYDLREGNKLLKLYPDRFKFIYYEDLIENPKDKVTRLFKYLGMDVNESKYPQVSKIAVFSDSTTRTILEQNTTYLWRLTLQWDIVQTMESMCSEVYKELGYKSISNLKDCKNRSISSVDIPKHRLINFPYLNES